MQLRLILAAALLAAFAGQPADARYNKKKPKQIETVTKREAAGIQAPDGSGPYYWTTVHTCDAKWFSDGLLKTCFGKPDTNRKRLEGPGATSFDADPSERVYYDPGPNKWPKMELASPRLLLVKDGGAVILVGLPSGKQTPSPYSDWARYPIWGASSNLVLIGQPGADGTVPAHFVGSDGSVAPALPGSDLRRLVRGAPSSMKDCEDRSVGAALPPENRKMPGWTEIQRRSLLPGGRTGTATLPADGNSADRCAQIMSHFFLARKEQTGEWHVLRAVDGTAVSPRGYATLAEAEAEAPAALARDTLVRFATIPLGENDRLASAVQAQQRSDQAIVDAARREEEARKAAEAARLARQQAEAEARWAVARSRANQYFAAGHYGMAIQEAEALPAEEYAKFVLAWRDAPLDTIDQARKRLEANGVSRIWNPTAKAIDARYSNLALCEGHLKGPDGYPLSQPRQSLWESKLPGARMIDMMRSYPGANTPGLAARDGYIWVFDATLYRWVQIYEPDPGKRHGNRVINEPSSKPDPQKLAIARQNYERCVREARAR